MKTTIQSWLAALVCAAFSVIASGLFLPKQSLWIDESMQLAGDRLGAAHIVPFLTGREKPADISPDRTPPIGYWIQQAWGSVFGLNEKSLRWLAVCCAAIATMFVFGAARPAGFLPAAAAGLLFALSPNVIYAAVDLRAYPFYILFSAATVWAYSSLALGSAGERTRVRGQFLREAEPLAPDPSSLRIGATKIFFGRLVLTFLFGILTCYTHFFGVVLCGALLFATAVTRRMNGKSLGLTAVITAIFLIAISGLVPFITASADVSKQIATDTESGSPLRDIIRLAYRLIGHPALAVSPALTAIALLGTLAALACVFATARKSALLVALLSGLIVVSLAAFIIKGFHPAAPQYNDWALPLLFVLLPAGLAGSKRVRAVTAMALTLLFIAEIYSTAQLALRGQYFAHGPWARIATDVQKLSPRRISIVIDDANPNTAGGAYYPLRDLLPRSIEQYVVVPSTTGPQVRPYGSNDSPVSIDSLKDRMLLVISSRNLSSAELTARLRTSWPESTPLLPTSAIVAPLKGRLVDTKSYLSFVAARTDLFEAAH